MHHICYHIVHVFINGRSDDNIDFYIKNIGQTKCSIKPKGVMQSANKKCKKRMKSYN
jgi:hypothetical protein